MAEGGKPRVALRKLAGNTIVTFGGMLLLKAIAFATTLVLARGLGREAYGLYSYVLSYLFFFSFVADLGVERVVTRQLAREPGRAGEILGTALVLKLGLSALALAAALVVARALGVPSEARYCIFVAGLGLPFSVELIFRGYFQARYQMKYAFAVAVPGSVAFLGVAAICAHLQLPVYALFYGALGIGLAMVTVLLMLAVRQMEGTLRVHWKTMPLLLRDALEIGLFVVLFMAAARLDHVMLFHMRSAVDVGLYAAAVRLTEAFHLIPDAVLVTVFPLLAGTEQRAPEVFRETYRLSAKYLVALAFGFALGLTALRREVLVFFFGSDFQGAAMALAILSWSLFFSFGGAVYLNLVIAKALQRWLIAVSALAVGVNAYGIWRWIPAYGAAGAAAATLVSNAVGLACWYAIPATRPHVRTLAQEALRPALAAAGAAGLLLWEPLRAIVLAPIVVALYGAVLWVVGGISRGDVRLLERAFAAPGARVLGS